AFFSKQRVASGQAPPAQPATVRGNGPARHWTVLLCFLPVLELGVPEMGLVPDSYVRRQWLDALSRLEYGTLDFVSPTGERIVANGREPGPHARFELQSWDVLRRVLARGDIGLGEEYIAGTWETDDIETLISLFLL